MRLLIATDAFKDALSAPEACRAIARGARQAWPQAQIREFPLADGGEGSLDILTRHLSLQTVEVPTLDPLHRPILATYGRSADGQTAFLEMASASGLQLLAPTERNPMHTSSIGTGLLLADAWEKGAREAILAIGGSATNDAGAGMAAALGWRFLDATRRAISPTGSLLHSIARIVPPNTSNSVSFQRVDVICDVNNPLCGPNGAARVYGPQKGASPTDVALLDAGLQHLAQLLEAQLNRPGLAQTPGAGAAGGLGFGALAFLNATLRPGAELMLDWTGFDQALTEADLVITGEGQLDAQTLQGKLLHGICQRARRFGVPVVALCGQIRATPEQWQSLGLQAAFPINPEGLALPEMLRRTAENLERTAAGLMWPIG